MTSTSISPLVLLKSGREGSSIFIVPGRNDDATVLSNFCNRIQFAGSIYGLQPRGFDGQDRPHDSVEAIAQDFVSAILDLQPSGSYNVMGVSLGGLVAFEAAHQLIQLGRTVSFLGLLDAYPDPRLWPLRCWLAVLAGRIRYHATTVLKLSANEVLPYVLRISDSLTDHLRSRFGGQPRMSWSKGATEGSETLRRLEESNVRALSRYELHKYPGKVTFVQARPIEVGGTKFPGDPSMIWRNLCETLELHIVPGDHGAMMRADSDKVASVLSGCLLEQHI
jgi:thioesterase domain-containing protein